MAWNDKIDIFTWFSKQKSYSFKITQIKNIKKGSRDVNLSENTWNVLKLISREYFLQKLKYHRGGLLILYIWLDMKTSL